MKKAGSCMAKYKVGVVGVRRGGSFLRIFSKSDRAEITAICDIDAVNLANAQKELGLADSQVYLDYDDFLTADLDIIIIGTPIPFHAEQSVKALVADKHVLCEVTAANTIEGCQAIYAAAKKSKGKYMLAENYIYFHFIQEWKQYVDAGKIGRIHYAEAEYIHDIRHLLLDQATGEQFWRKYRPPIHYCTHCLGPLMFLLGDDSIVKATASGVKNTIMPELWPSSIDMQVALFETRQGRGIKICRSQVTPRPDPHTVYYSVYGTEGFLENTRQGYEVVGNRYFAGLDDTTVPFNCYQTRVEAPEYAKGGHGTSDYYLVQAFLDSIEFDLEPPINVDRAMQITLPGLVAHEAAVKGHVWLDVPQFT
jgi:predicted dehydrogenase